MKQVKELKYYSINEIVAQCKLSEKQIRTKVVRYAQAYPLTNLIKKENNIYKVAKAMIDKIYENQISHKSFTLNTTIRPVEQSQLDEVMRNIFFKNNLSELVYTIETKNNRLHIHGSVKHNESKLFVNAVRELVGVPYMKDEFYSNGWLQYITKENNATYLTNKG